MLGWGVIAEGGVAERTIEKHLDILKDVLGGFVPCGVVPMVHQLILERPEKAFDAGIDSTLQDGYFFYVLF